MRLLVVAIACATPACTVLGTVPTSTGLSPIPAQRPSVDLQGGLTPAFELSAATRADPTGTVVPQGAAVIEPDRLLHLPGLVLGARVIDGQPRQLDPYLGYRRYLDEGKALAIAIVGFGSKARDTRGGASVDLTRAGAVMIVDFDLSGPSRTAELHLVAAASATALWADGNYCVDSQGWGIDCDAAAPAPRAGRIDGAVLGMVRGGLGLDLLRHRRGPLHGIRAEMTVAAGTMPQLRNGAELDPVLYGSASLSLTVALGAGE